MRTSLFYNLLDTVFFAEILLAKKFDLQTIVLGQPFCIRTDLVPQRLCPFGVVEYADTFCSEQTAHPISIADAGDSSCKYDSVKARECALNLVCVTINKLFHDLQYSQNCVYKYSPNLCV